MRRTRDVVSFFVALSFQILIPFPTGTAPARSSASPSVGGAGGAPQQQEGVVLVRGGGHGGHPFLPFLLESMMRGEGGRPGQGFRRM